MVSDPNRVTVGIDAAVVANHQVAIRGSAGGEVIAEDFAVAPTLAGMERLTERLSEYRGGLVVAEPTPTENRDTPVHVEGSRAGDRRGGQPRFGHSRRCLQALGGGPEDSVAAAVKAMEEDAIRRVPVVENGNLVGIVSIGDLAGERDPESALGEISAAPPNN